MAKFVVKVSRVVSTHTEGYVTIEGDTMEKAYDAWLDSSLYDPAYKFKQAIWDKESRTKEKDFHIEGVARA